MTTTTNSTPFLLSGLRRGTQLYGLFVFLFALALVIHGVLAVKLSLNRGRFGIADLELEKDEVGYFIEVNALVPDYPAERAGFKVGDRIYAIDGVKIDKDNWNTIWGDPYQGTSIKTRVKRDADWLTITMTRALIPFFERIVDVMYLLVVPLLLLVFVSVGLFAVTRRKDISTVLIAMVCFSFGMLLTTVRVNPIPTPIAQFLHIYGVWNVLLIANLHLAPAFWLYLFFFFPKNVPWARQRPVLAALSVFSLPLVLTAVSALTPDLFDRHEWYNFFYFAYFTTYGYLGVRLVRMMSRRAEQPLERRRYGYILFGIQFGSFSIMLGFASLIIYVMVARDSFNTALFIYPVFLLAMVGALVIPYTFLNSFSPQKVIETESGLKRRVQFFSASFGLFMLYLALCFFMSKWLIWALGLTDPSLIVLFVLLLALTFSPVNRLLLRRLEQKLYPDRVTYRESLNQFFDQNAGVVESELLIEKLTEWLRETMQLYPVKAVAWTGNHQQTMDPKSKEVLDLLNRRDKAQYLIWDEQQDMLLGSPENGYGMLDDDYTITVPMRVRGQALGLLHVGRKVNQEDLNGDDLSVLREAADRTALILNNLDLYAQNLEKKRMDKELAVARSIQARLMPQSVPSIPNLEVSAHCLTCFEVGGDYYDVIRLNDDRHALVVADVSGKGAGAALLMSNLQAGMRVALAVGLPLSEVVNRMNHLVVQNSLKNQFVTLFVGVWDGQVLEYINAGHNPPVVVQAQGEVHTLKPNGPGLGIFSDETFPSAQREFSAGDVLVIYTDGLEETFNRDLEMYGLGRIIERVKTHRRCSAEEIVEALIHDAESFSGRPERDDDLTLIVGRVGGEA